MNRFLILHYKKLSIIPHIYSLNVSKERRAPRVTRSCRVRGNAWTIYERVAGKERRERERDPRSLKVIIMHSNKVRIDAIVSQSPTDRPQFSLAIRLSRAMTGNLSSYSSRRDQIYDADFASHRGLSASACTAKGHRLV